MVKRFHNPIDVIRQGRGFEKVGMKAGKEFVFLLQIAIGHGFQNGCFVGKELIERPDQNLGARGDRPRGGLLIALLDKQRLGRVQNLADSLLAVGLFGLAADDDLTAVDELNLSLVDSNAYRLAATEMQRDSTVAALIQERYQSPAHNLDDLAQPEFWV